MSAKIWTVAAAKGGVGKTFIASSLAITLSKLNFSVLAVDLDPSGANLHTHFGKPISERNISLYTNQEAKLFDLIQETATPRVSMIQGFSNTWSSVDLKNVALPKLMEDLKALPFDFVIVDLGAGCTHEHMQLLDSSDEILMISNPEPSSVEKNYRLLEAWLSYKLGKSATADAKMRLETALKNHKSQPNKGFFSFRNYLKEQAGFTFDYFSELDRKPIRLIINESRSRGDEDLGHSIKSVCKKYFDLSIDYIGCVDFDNAVWQSISAREPVLLAKPFTPVAGELLSIARYLSSDYVNLSATSYKAVV